MIIDTGEHRSFESKMLAEKEMFKLKREGYGVKIYPENKLPKKYYNNPEKRILGKNY